MPTAREMEAVANIEVAKNSDDVEPSANLEDDDKPKRRRRRRRRKPRKDDIATNSSEGSDDINQVDTPILIVLLTKIQKMIKNNQLNQKLLKSKENKSQKR